MKSSARGQALALEQPTARTSSATGAGDKAAHCLVADAFDQSVDELRRFIRDPGVGRSLAPLVSCLGGALDRHIKPDRPPFLPILLPLLVRGAIDGQPKEAMPVSVASALLFLSFDLLDDIQDGDEREWWKPFNRAQLLLAAASFPATLPHQILVAGVPHATQVAALARALGAGLLEIADGQAADLAAFDATDINAESVEHSVAGKSGAQMGLYARIAALHACRDDTVVELWSAWAHGLGTAGQLGSDLQDLLDESWCRDLAAGARTLPIAFAMQRLDRKARHELSNLLTAAKADRAAQLFAREQIGASGAVLYTAFRQKIHLTRAENALQRLDCFPGWRHLLARLPQAQSHSEFLHRVVP